MRALRRQTLFLHLTAGAPAGKPAACRRIRLPDGCGAVALSDRRTVLRSKLRIANESAAQCRCGHRTAVRATPHANAGWIGRSKIRLSKEPPARRRFRTPLRRNETGRRGRAGERTSLCASRQTPRHGRPRPKIRGRLCRRGARRFVPDGNVFPLCAVFVRGRMRRETERALLPRKGRPAQQCFMESCGDNDVYR